MAMVMNADQRSDVKYVREVFCSGGTLSWVARRQWPRDTTLPRGFFIPHPPPPHPPPSALWTLLIQCPHLCDAVVLFRRTWPCVEISCSAAARAWSLPLYHTTRCSMKRQRLTCSRQVHALQIPPYCGIEPFQMWRHNLWTKRNSYTAVTPILVGFLC